MMSKQDLKAMGIESPNTAEALAVTFANGYERIGKSKQNDFWYRGAGVVESASELTGGDDTEESGYPSDYPLPD